MPELPEVETIRKGLREVIVGKQIADFENRDKKVVRFEPEEVNGARIESIERRSKILILKLSYGVISNDSEKSHSREDLSSPLNPPSGGFGIALETTVGSAQKFV